MKPTLHRFSFLFFLVTPFVSVFAQTDTTQLLNEVVVTAYKSNRSISYVPASVAVLSPSEINRFSDASLVSSVNAVPGVRMEERSPGSYRFSIRGSLLRSPFGIRNVKFYWNGLPLTDGGGNTYFNLIDNSELSTIEIIKGPGGSLYGAGTGGVVLLTPNTQSEKPSFRYSTLAGSFGLFKIQGDGMLLVTPKSKVSLGTAYQQSDGYRDHTQMKRFATNLDWTCSFNERNSLATTFFVTNLFYETPGALTKDEFDANPAQARPATSLPGAVQQNASVKNISSYLGTMYTHHWGDQWTTQAGVFTSLTSFSNPTIRNYEIRDEKNLGGRTETQGLFVTGDVKWKVTVGGEYQYFVSPVDVFDNIGGHTGDLQTSDKLWSSGGILFSQAEMEFLNHVFVTVGLSANFLQYKFLQTSVSPEVSQRVHFDPEYLPRVAILKRINKWSFFGSLSSGFSPPTLAEVRPSTGALNENLKPESGLSFELGMRGVFFKHFNLDVVAYNFDLQKTIVLQRDASGADYFINAGSTKQQGLETSLRYTSSSELLKIWTNYTFNDFYFDTYVKDGVNYSGNQLTGVARNIFVAGADLTHPKGIYINATFNYTDRLPLNDANSEYTEAYYLLSARIGFRKSLKKLKYDFYVGVDNSLNQHYSLGNDLNAAGGRYYNAAPTRNYFMGLRISI